MEPFCLASATRFGQSGVVQHALVQVVAHCAARFSLQPEDVTEVFQQGHRKIVTDCKGRCWRRRFSLFAPHALFYREATTWVKSIRKESDTSSMEVFQKGRRKIVTECRGRCWRRRFSLFAQHTLFCRVATTWVKSRRKESDTSSACAQDDIKGRECLNKGVAKQGPMCRSVFVFMIRSSDTFWRTTDFILKIIFHLTLICVVLLGGLVSRVFIRNRDARDTV
jgi:hypothetical protein